MTGTFLATWIRLRRRNVLVGTLAATAAITALTTALTFALADTPADQRPGPRNGANAEVTTTTLSSAEGLLQGLSLSLTLFGIIAFCLGAATLAGEYGSGTIRTMLLREPRRVRLMIGTWSAVASFVAGAVLLASVVAGVLALLLAPSQDVDTAAWFTGEGLTTSGRTVLQAILAAVGYATLGTAFGILLRTAIPAVVIGFGWLFLFETIVANSAPASGRWLPGQLLSAVATDGTAQIGFLVALAGAGGWVLVASAAALAAFNRRDVTA